MTVPDTVTDADTEWLNAVMTGTEASPPTPTGDPDTTWRPISLADAARAILDGTAEQPRPTVGDIDGSDLGLFYAGRINSLLGKGGDGKSMLAAYVGAQLIRSGRVVWWVDFEDSEIGLAARLLDLGLTPDELEEPRTRYFRPSEKLTTQRRDELLRLAGAERPDMVVIDSTGEWMSAHGVDPNADEQVARWFAECARPLADLGAAVVTVDHLPHASDGRLSPIGSTRKYNAISGAAYRLDAIDEFGRGQVGKAKLTTAKDRWGHHPRGKTVATFTLDATVAPYAATLTASTGTPATNTGGFRPTHLMDKVVAYLGVHPDANKTMLRGLGKGEYVDRAVELLVDEGYVVATAAGQSLRHRLTGKPYHPQEGTP